MQALVTRADTATVVDRDLPRSNPSADLQRGERDRDRVAVLSDREKRLLINPGCRGLAGVNGSLGNATSSGRLIAHASPTLFRRPSIRRPRSPSQPASSIALSSARSATRESATKCFWRKRPTSPCTPPFLMGPFDARCRELRHKQVARQTRTLRRPLRTFLTADLEVVKADLREHAAQRRNPLLRQPPRAQESDRASRNLLGPPPLNRPGCPPQPRAFAAPHLTNQPP